MADRTYLIENTLYAEVTERIITALEAGVAPWVRPWRADAEGGRPRNGSTSRPYTSVNFVLACAAGYSSSRWYTRNQASLLKGRLPQDEVGTTLVMWRYAPSPPADDPVPDLLAGEPTTSRVLRSYVAYNAVQITWPQCSSHMIRVPSADGAGAASDDNYEHVEAFVADTGARIVEQGTRAYYSPIEDVIFVPIKASFESASAFYAAVLVGLARWTGHPSRLDRKPLNHLGPDAAAFEHLICDIAAAFLGADLGVEGMLHPEHIGSWIRVLKSDTRAIFVASRMAQQAADYLSTTVTAARGLVPPGEPLEGV